jgi:hypothetical protein
MYSSFKFSKNLEIKLYKTIILQFYYMDVKDWEERWLRIFANRIPRRIFRPNRDANGEWRRLHKEKFHSLYRSPNKVRVIKSRRLRWAGYVARMDEGRSAKILTYRKETFMNA